MSVKEVSVSSEYKKLISDGAVVVDFSATWCGPCRRVEPVFKELAKSNKNIKFVRVDIDEASETMPNELQGISGVPTFRFFFDGKQIDTFSGANLNRLRENVDKLKKKLADSEKSNDEASSNEAKSSSESEEENKVAHVSTNQEFTKIISHGKVVVDFSASWCFPCKMIAPTFEELAKDNKDIKFVKIDIDEAAEELEDVLAGIIGVPTFFYYLDGEVIDRMSGANVRTLKEKLRQLSARESTKKEEKPEEKTEEKTVEKTEEKVKEEEDQCSGGTCCKKPKETSQENVDEKKEVEKKTDEETGEAKEVETPAEPQTESKEEKNEDASTERSDPQPEQKNESGSDETSEQKVEDKLEASTSGESTDQKMEQDEAQPAKEEPAQEDKKSEEPTTTSTEEKTEEHEKSD